MKRVREKCRIGWVELWGKRKGEDRAGRGSAVKGLREDKSMEGLGEREGRGGGGKGGKGFGRVC